MASAPLFAGCPSLDLVTNLVPEQSDARLEARGWLDQPPDYEHEDDYHEDADKAVAGTGESEGDCGGHFVTP